MYQKCGADTKVRLNVLLILEIATPCLTPYNESGGCISIKNCPSILHEIKKRLNTSIEFVRKSRCVPQDKLNTTDIFVCCKTRNVSSRTAGIVEVKFRLQTYMGLVLCLTQFCLPTIKKNTIETILISI